MSPRISLDESERSLYRAAREESPSPAARTQTLDALRRADLVARTAWTDARDDELERAARPAAAPDSTAVRAFSFVRSAYLPLAAAGCALGVAIALYTHRPRAPGGRDAERDIVPDLVRDDVAANQPAHAAPRPEASAPGVPAVSDLHAVSGLHEERGRPVSKSKAPAGPPTLAEEIDALDRARTALGEGQPRQALAALDAYHDVLRGYRLTDEATLLRIEALQRAAMPADARSLALRFAARNPDSPLVDRALSLVGAQREPEPGSGPKESSP